MKAQFKTAGSKAPTRFLPRQIFTVMLPPLISKGRLRAEDAFAFYTLGILNDFAENPTPYLDEETKKKLAAVNAMLLRKFTEFAFDEMAEARWQESRPVEADNIDVGPLTEADLHGDLFDSSGNLF